MPKVCDATDIGAVFAMMLDGFVFRKSLEDGEQRLDEGLCNDDVLEIGGDIGRNGRRVFRLGGLGKWGG